jgi:hypothetical protein
MTAALQSIQFVENMSPDTRERQCKPNEIEPDLLVQAFVTYVKQVQDAPLKGPAVIVLRLALIKSYPTLVPCNW